MDRSRAQRRALLSPLRGALRAALGLALLALVLPIHEGRGEEQPAPGEGEATPGEGPTPGQSGLRRVGRVRLNPEDIPQAARQKQLKREASPLGRRGQDASAHVEAAYRAMKNGRHYRAVLALDDARRAGQRDPRVQELSGAAWASLGFYADALGAFRVASSGPYYEEFGVRAHADALRAVGEGEAAASLRRTLLVEPMEEQQELALMLEIGDDYLLTGDGWGAEQVLLEAYAAFPRATAVHVSLAEAYALQGDEESAGFHLWMADSAPVGVNFRELLYQARVELDAGRLHTAEELILKLTRRRQQNVTLLTMRCEMLVAQGTPDAAWALLENSYWREHGDPELSASRALVLDALGRRAEALATLQEGLDLYPSHPSLQRAAAALR